MTIYVVEDSRAVAEALAELIRATPEHPVVRVFTDPFLALHAARKDRPELIVTDLIMPKIDGISLIRELRKVDINAQAIVMSSTPGMKTNKLLPGNNISAVLPKPCRTDDLRSAVMEALESAHSAPTAYKPEGKRSF